jgi:putative addiction module component (TIGR02574 family)
MSDQTRQVLKQALRLPQRERATLVAELLRTLDDEGDEGLTQEEWEKAWAAEIDRRVREIREGKAELIDGDEALRRVRAGLKPRRRK